MWNAGCVVQCIHYLLLGVSTIALGVMGLAPLQCDLSVLVKLQAASSFSTHKSEDSSTYRQPARAAGHEPVCLVPGSVDKYLPVRDCTLQKSLDTHSEGFLLC